MGDFCLCSSLDTAGPCDGKSGGRFVLDVSNILLIIFEFFIRMDIGRIQLCRCCLFLSRMILQK